MKRINPSNVKFVNTLVQTRIILVLWKLYQFMKNRNRSNMILVTFSNTTSITFSRKSYLKRLLDQFMRGRNHLKINVKFVNSFVFKIVTLNIMLCQFMRRSNYSNVIYATTFLLKTITWKSILIEFMRERNHLNVTFVT